jgi:hypothetical protein
LKIEEKASRKQRDVLPAASFSYRNFVAGCFYRARSRRIFLATTPSRCTGSAPQINLDYCLYLLHGLGKQNSIRLEFVSAVWLKKEKYLFAFWRWRSVMFCKRGVHAIPRLRITNKKIHRWLMP